ncbi:MAG TPA: molybdopterin-guanine dinucleotide biosynthesis protein B [Anaerolineae bacterium]|nr:molybdopterin-guanine dinucleotide biosynthesis protein B [Anaerolineae bacterium]
MIPVVCIVGESGVGKTTFLEKLIAELKRRGYRVGTIKHHIHDFEVDRPGKDSWRHARAGSDVVVIASPYKLSLIERLEREPTLDEVAARITGVDIILAEGYKHSDKPKIEVFRREMGGALLSTPDELVALVTDQPVDLNVPQFDPDDAVGAASLLEARFLLGTG